MEDNIKFGHFHRKDYFNVEFKEFKKELLGNKSNKCVQLYINDEPIIIAGDDLYHRDILKLYFKKFNLKFGTRLNASKDEIPLEKGKGYEMVGAGRVCSVDNKMLFYDNSTDYIAKLPNGINKKHLEDFFGAEKVKELDKKNGAPSFLVEI